MSALSAMQDKTQHLENSLSAETRIKLDLFSALGDAKRQLEIAQGHPDFHKQHPYNISFFNARTPQGLKFFGAVPEIRRGATAGLESSIDNYMENIYANVLTVL